MKFACPNCGQHLDADDGFAGQVIGCPSCSHELTVPGASAGITQSVVAPAAPPLSPPIVSAGRSSIGRPSAPSTPPPATASGSEDWETTPAGSGKIAFLATPKKGHGYEMAMEQEATSRATIYSACSFLIAMFFWKGGFAGGLAMLILVMLFLGFIKLLELMTAKSQTRRLEELRRSSMNPSNFGAGFEPCATPSCDLCRTALAAPLGHLLTTTQVVNSSRFWSRYWQVHEPSIKAIGKAQGMSIVPSFHFFAANYNTLKQLHFIFERVAGNGKPWLVCDDCLRCFGVRHDAPGSGSTGIKKLRGDLGAALVLVIFGGVFLLSALLVLLDDGPSGGLGTWIGFFVFLAIGGGLAGWGVKLWCRVSFNTYLGREINSWETAAFARKWWETGRSFSPPDSGPPQIGEIYLASFAARTRIVASQTIMTVGAVPLLMGLVFLFTKPILTSGICLVIGASLVLLGRKLWKS